MFWKFLIEDIYSEHSIQRNYADIRSVKVEDRLNGFIIGLIIASHAIIAKEREWGKQRKIREEEERKRKEALEAIENEKRKITLVKFFLLHTFIT